VFILGANFFDHRVANGGTAQAFVVAALQRFEMRVHIVRVQDDEIERTACLSEQGLRREYGRRSRGARELHETTTIGCHGKYSTRFPS
jgi:hypothetical protein